MGLIALLWGFAEATVFFIIPDVFLTYVAITQKNKHIIIKMLCLTLIGALIGGTLVYITALINHDMMKSILFHVPSVQPYMLDHVTKAMNDNPFIGLISGPLFGIPYKMFAFAAPQYLNLSLFLICSIPARLLRFVIVTIIAYWLSHHVLHRLTYRKKVFIWLVVWSIVYIIYFSVHGI